MFPPGLKAHDFQGAPTARLKLCPATRPIGSAFFSSLPVDRLLRLALRPEI